MYSVSELRMYATKWWVPDEIRTQNLLELA